MRRGRERVKKGGKGGKGWKRVEKGERGWERVEGKKENKEEKERRKEGQKETLCGCAIARVGTAQEKVQVRCTAAVSCHVLCVALWRVTVAKSSRLPTLRAGPPQPHAPCCFWSSRCARAQKVPSASAPSFSHSLGSRRPGVPLPSRASPAFCVPAWWLDPRLAGPGEAGRWHPKL